MIGQEEMYGLATDVASRKTVDEDDSEDDVPMEQCTKKQRSSADPWCDAAFLKLEPERCSAGESGTLCAREVIERMYGDGSKFTGEVCNSHHKRNGRGRFVNAKNDSYDGYWKDDKRHGGGVYKWTNGDCYEGEWIAGRMHGQGCFKWANGDEYTGCWHNGHMHGHGTKRMTNGDSYSGDWRNDRANGRGVKTFSGGDKHEGCYMDDKRQGFGVYMWASGDKYVGNWENGKMHGHGTKTMANGDSYEGTWVEDKAHHYGEKRFAGGDRHEGYYKCDKRHGYGVYYWKHGDRFEGTWVLGELRGKGTYYYGNHSIFKGEWAQGRKHGVGMFTTNSTSYKEVWEHGIRVSKTAADKFYPPRLLRTYKEECNVEMEDSNVNIKQEIDRLQGLLAKLQSGQSVDQQQPDILEHDTAAKQGAEAAAPGESAPENSKDMSSEDTCKICYDEKVNCVLIRCGHMCTCLECSKQLEKCPICRKHIDDVIQIFKS
jgi:hypothetical protein